MKSPQFPDTIITMIYLITVIVLILLWLVFSYNRLVTLRTRAEEATSDIDVQSKRRYDLIPNLVETVKGYMAHEREVLENVTKARTSIMGGGDVLGKANAENQLSGTLKTLFAVSENYPQLRANENFLKLQDELTDTENKMQAARRFYNATVMDLNTKIQMFPTNLIASTFGFQKMNFFETSDSERQPVSVKF